MPLPLTDPLAAGVSAAAGTALGGAIVRYLATSWLKKREEFEAEIREALASAETRCISRCDAAFSATAVGRDELRKHFDTEIARLGGGQHDMREKMGVWMERVEQQKRELTAISGGMKSLSDEMRKVAINIARLTARLEGSGQLRRASDVSDDGGNNS